MDAGTTRGIGIQFIASPRSNLQFCQTLSDNRWVQWNTPKRRLSLWILANVSSVCTVPALALHLERELRAGTFPVEADSISLPIVGAAVWILTLLFPLNITWWYLLRGYPGRVSLATRVKGLRGWQKSIAVVGMLVAIACFAIALDNFCIHAWELAVMFLLMAYISLAMRAAFVASSQRRLESRPST